MAAVVTDPPILIDPVGYSRQSNSEINPMFFPLSRTNLYQGLARNIAAAGQLTNAVNAWKSTDVGATWPIQDAANSPGHRDSFFSYRAGVIQCAVQSSTSPTYTVTPFDTATDLWGSTSPVLTLAEVPNTPSGGKCAQVIDKPNGDVVFLWCAPATSTKLKAAVLSAGVWGSITDALSLANGSYLTGAIVDPATGAIFVTYGRGSDDEYFCVRLDNSLLAGTPKDLGSGDTLRADMKLWGADSIAIGYGANSDLGAHVSIGTPLSNPVFTDYLVGPVTGSAYTLYTALAVDLTGKLNAFYGYQDYSGPSPYVDELRQTTFDGVSAWSTPILFYDAVTNPPPNTAAPIDQFIHTLQVADQFPNGQWIASTALEILIPGEVCAGHVLVSPAVSLILTCPVGGGTATLGSPYTATLSASGGTAPYTYSISGGPSWLLLDPVTGILSGTPNLVGTFSYTATVTDSLGATATVTAPCAITVAGTSPPTLSPPHTLRYQIPQKRWFPHAYADRMIFHYLDEINDFYGIQYLLMLSGSHTIWESLGNLDNQTPITWIATTPANDGGDERLQKLFVDQMFDVDGSGPIQAYIQYNNQTINGPSLTVTPVGTRAQFLENISSLADLGLYRNISTTFSATGGPDGPRLYAAEPSGFAQPYISRFFVTQYINFAYPGWKAARRFYPALISNFDVLMTIKTQDDRVYGPYTIPSTGGQFRIIPMILNHGVKDLAFAIQLDGQNHDFAFFPQEWVIEVKGWADPEFIDLAVFRT